ncbi:MAG: hypothetical protein HN428_05340 [Proteobacteria bacterium]|nr:hypothetical protein [Pseudomonadota bacterium]
MPPKRLATGDSNWPRPGGRTEVWAAFVPGVPATAGRRYEHGLRSRSPDEDRLLIIVIQGKMLRAPVIIASLPNTTAQSTPSRFL